MPQPLSLNQAPPETMGPHQSPPLRHVLTQLFLDPQPKAGQVIGTHLSKDKAVSLLWEEREGYLFSLGVRHATELN